MELSDPNRKNKNEVRVGHPHFQIASLQLQPSRSGGIPDPRERGTGGTRRHTDLTCAGNLYSTGAQSRYVSTLTVTVVSTSTAVLFSKSGLYLYF